MEPVERAILEAIYQPDTPVGTRELFLGIEARGFKQSEAFPLIDSLVLMKPALISLSMNPALLQYKL